MNQKAAEVVAENMKEHFRDLFKNSEENKINSWANPFSSSNDYGYFD